MEVKSSYTCEVHALFLCGRREEGEDGGMKEDGDVSLFLQGSEVVRRFGTVRLVKSTGGLRDVPL